MTHLIACIKKLLLVSVLLFACSKEKINKGPYYDQFIGKWECVNCGEKVEIDVKKGGHIEVTHEVDRAYTIGVEKSLRGDTLQKYGKKWIKYEFFSSNYGIDLCRELVNGDSLYSVSALPNIQNGELKYPQIISVFTKK